LGRGDGAKGDRFRKDAKSVSPVRRGRNRPDLEWLETRQLLSTFVVRNTLDDLTDPKPGGGTGTLRQAIIDANAAATASQVFFDIPASTAPGLNVPVPGFDPVNQDWTISLLRSLPPLVKPIWIDGYTQAEAGVAYQYPTALTLSTITSSPNATAATGGGTHKMINRVIVDGSTHQVGGTGFDIAASQCILRGLIISGFGVGVEVDATDGSGNPIVGDLIQGNFIGDYFVYPVDPQSGIPLTGGASVGYLGPANTQQAVIVSSSNTTIGGNNPQEMNIICGNGVGKNPLPAIVIEPGATGNQVLGNQIGVAGPATNGLYVQDGNGAEGILVYSSSNAIGGSSTGAGNVISANGVSSLGAPGIHLSGVDAIRNQILGNLVGLAPGGGYRFGSGDPGNQGDGVLIEDGAQNQVGGATQASGNAIAANEGAGISIVGASATLNTISYNKIGLTSDGTQVLGNIQEGVALYSPKNTVGPGNVISGNLLGVAIYGPGASGILVSDNLIGTDGSGGEFGFGNVHEGIRIDNSPANTIQGNAAGSQVISGNDVGIAIDGPASTGNLLLGNLIGTDITGGHDLNNKDVGILISGGIANTIGGNTPITQNLISANHTGIELEADALNNGASGNLIQGNYIGTDITGLAGLSNEIVGILVSSPSSKNTIGGTTADLGNRIAFHKQDGVQVVGAQAVGNSILSNSIFANGHLGIDLVTPSPAPGPNDLQAAPALNFVTTNGSLTHIKLTLQVHANTQYLVQFFTNPALDPSGFGQGQKRFGSTTVSAGKSGNVTLDATLTMPFPPGAILSATATNETTGDTSGFSGDRTESPAIEFSAATFTIIEADGQAVIRVTRTLGLGATTFNYATSNGTAIAPLDYTQSSGTLTLNPGQTSTTFAVPIHDDGLNENTIETVNLNLTAVSGGVVDFQSSAVLRIVDNDLGTSNTFVVTNTNDSGSGSLRQAILDANARPGSDDIEFAIPASTDPELNVPVDGFDPVTQTWRIQLETALPTISDTVSIDGYTQAHFPIPYRYPNAFTATQVITVTGNPTGGSFTLSTQSPLPILTTGDLPYNATAADLQLNLVEIFGTQNVAVSGGPANVAPFTVRFIGDFQGKTPPLLVPTSQLTGGVDPAVNVVGSAILQPPTQIQSSPNTVNARDGNTAQIRVIVDGSQIPGGGPGFVLDTNNSMLRGLIIDGFTVGVSVPRPVDVGNLIQGNSLGAYLAYPVDANSGIALPSPDNVEIAGAGNSLQGVYIDANNTTIGGTNPQENNVIANSGLEGIMVDHDAHGNVMEGNQVGTIGPSINGRYARVPNQREGVLLLGSSNVVGGPGGGSGNLISANQLSGVHIQGTAATRNIVAGNVIGLAPGGGYLFGTGNPGNRADGVWIDNAAQNQVGGPDSTWTNVISSNGGAGVHISGILSVLDPVENNLIGLTADGKAVKGNLGEGVLVLSPRAVIGPGNVISGNLRGVHISGSAASGVVVRDNLIGTDMTGTFDLGNGMQGILIENATDAQILGNSKGSQVISGNQVGIVISGPAATRNLIRGNLIGSDRTGLNAIPNAQEGVLIQNAPGNTLGGTTAAAQNLISSNHWGVRLDDAATQNNLLQGNLIGPDITGTGALGDEINGVIVSNGASNNTIGGTSAGAGNTIAFNVLAGVSVEAGTGDSILTNGIYSNGNLGIDLVAAGDPARGLTPDPVAPASPIRSGPDNLQPYPILTTAVGGGSGSAIQGGLYSVPNTKFLIQFFTSQVPDPSGFGQGQTPIGSTTVTTDGSGNAKIAFIPPTSLAASVWATATATNLATGDTSEFSNAVSAEPVTIQFQTAALAVDASAGSVLVDVQRTGNLNALVSVSYATSNGTAIAGKDYGAVSGTLTFPPGQKDMSFNVPILVNPSQTASSVTANLILSQPTGGATLGAPSTETLTVNVNLPPILQFRTSTYTAYSTAGSVVVTVIRTGGNARATVQVQYATGGGTAVPGADYTPSSGVLTFLPNQMAATFSVPLLANHQAAGSTSVGLALSNPGGTAQLGPLNTANLTIVTASATPSGPVDTTPPQVTAEQLVLGAGGITAVLFTFSKPLNPARAADLGNYGYYAIVAGPDGLFGSSDDGYTRLASAQYNPQTSTVALYPSVPLPLNSFTRITLDALTNPLLNRGLADTSGNLLSGLSNGIAGSPFVTTFGVGSQLTYADNLGKTVSLSLTGGGLIEMFRAASGDVQTVSLLGAVPRKSVLSLHANSAGGRYTYLPRISGAAGVRLRYKTPPIVFRSTPFAPAAAAPRAKAKPVVVKKHH
jgi:hypothetical protein